MAWTYFPLSVATLPAKGLQEWGIWQELIDAVSERKRTVGGGVFANPFTDVTASGTAVAQAVALANIQSGVENLVLANAFINHLDNGGNWHGIAGQQGSAPAALGPKWTLGTGTHNIFLPQYANVGNSTNWTRRAGSDPDALSTLYGRVTAGDVHGLYREGGIDKIAEYLNEIYRVLDLLRWTKKIETSSILPLPIQNDPIEEIYTEPGAQFVSPLAAYNDLVARWPGVFVPNTHQPPTPPIGTSTFLWVKHTVQVQWVSGPPDKFRAYGRNTRCRVSITIPTTAFAHSIDLYGQTPSNDLGDDPRVDEFDFDGLGYEQDKVSLVQTIPENYNNPDHSTFIGSDASVQDQPATDPSASGDRLRVRGYTLRDAVAIIKWDGPSGFTKVS